MELDKVLEMFRFLSSPFDDAGNVMSTSGTAGRPSSVLENITEHCLKQIELLDASKSLLEDDKELCSSWKLTCVILAGLAKLRTCIEELENQQTEEEKAIDVLSVQSQIIVQKSVELVLGFGVVPYLLPGVGVPAKLRKRTPSVSYFLEDAEAASPYEKFLRLAHTLEILLISSGHPSLNTLVVPKYASDLLAGLLQICNSPIAQPNPSVPNSLSEEQYSTVMNVREKLKELMGNTFLASVSPGTLINSLFLIGSTPKPRWISQACNLLLYETILSKNGLILVATTMLDTAGHSEAWKLMRVISSLAKNALISSRNSKCPQKLGLLLDQCIFMVRESQKQRDTNLISTSASQNLELMQIGLYAALTLMEIDFDFVKLKFWNQLFCNLISLNMLREEKGVSERQPPDSRCGTCVDISNISLCTVYAKVLLEIVKPSGVSVPLKAFQPLWSLFLQIFVACKRYLQRPVQEPKLAAVAEDLCHQVKDVLILLLDIYDSGLGQRLALPVNEEASKKNLSDKMYFADKAVDLCDFSIMLLLNENVDGTPVLNTFDLRNNEICNNTELTSVYLEGVHQEVISSGSDYNEVFANYLEPASICLAAEVLKSDRLKGIWPRLFRQLMAWGTGKGGGGISKPKTFKSDKMPTRLEANSAPICVEDCQRFITFKLLGELGEEEAILEQFGNTESVQETLTFLQLLLNKFTNEACSRNEFDSSQLIMYALGIIGALVEATTAATSSSCSQLPGDLSASSLNEEADEMWSSLEAFIPDLRKLTNCQQPTFVRQGGPEIASNLILSIGTRGANVRSTRAGNEVLKTRFQLAMEDAHSVMVHVKGHGLLELRRLIEGKDEEATRNDSQILKVFQQNLTNDDSYVYLMCIQGMAALALKFHRIVVPELIKEYDLISPEEEGKVPVGHKRVFQTSHREEQIDTRIKIGEILVKVIQRLGEFAPSYRAPLTNVFFRLMRDDEPLIRASALSNLGELCHLLKFTLGIVLTEVWFCVESILHTEKDVHVRRAALHLIVLLLKGMEKDLRPEDILSDSIIPQYLRDVRRILTQTESSEVDLIAKTHCQLALRELELIVNKLIMPSNALSFKIRVMDLSY